MEPKKPDNNIASKEHRIYERFLYPPSGPVPFKSIVRRDNMVINEMYEVVYYKQYVFDTLTLLERPDLFGKTFYFHVNSALVRYTKLQKKTPEDRERERLFIVNKLYQPVDRDAFRFRTDDERVHIPDIVFNTLVYLSRHGSETIRAKAQKAIRVIEACQEKVSKFTNEELILSRTPKRSTRYSNNDEQDALIALCLELKRRYPVNSVITLATLDKEFAEMAELQYDIEVYTNLYSAGSETTPSYLLPGYMTIGWLNGNYTGFDGPEGARKADQFIQKYGLLTENPSEEQKKLAEKFIRVYSKVLWIMETIDPLKDRWELYIKNGMFVGVNSMSHVVIRIYPEWLVEMEVPYESILFPLLKQRYGRPILENETKEKEAEIEEQKVSYGVLPP